MAGREPFHLLYVGTLHPHPGGAAISASQLLVGLAARGNRIDALAPWVGPAAATTAAADDLLQGISVTRFDVPYWNTSPHIGTSDEYREHEGGRIRERLPPLLARRRPDLILIGRETFADHVGELASDAQLPVIQRIAGATAIGMLQRTVPPSYSANLVAHFKRAAALVTPAEHMARRLQQLGVYGTTVIPNAVDTERFSPGRVDDLRQAHTIEPGQVVVAHISGLESTKNPLEFVAAAAVVDRASPGHVYIVVGDGPLRGAMEERVLSLRLGSSFWFTGWVPYAQMHHYFNLADIVVMPCLDETQARVYLETQSCARLLIASDIPAAREVVTDGETGLLYPAGDTLALAQVMLDAISDPMRRNAIGRSARAYVRQKHPMSSAVHAYAALCRSVLQA